jgi:fibrillarin-like rRNA methylase
MPRFNAGTYEIYWYKDQVDTPNSIQSPVTSNTVSPVNKINPVKAGVAIGVGLTVAKRAWNTVRSEITASTGDEIMQTNINNAMKLVGYVGAIAVGGAVGAAMVGADIALNAITYTRDFNRKERLKSLERELQGKRANIANGSAYYG